MNSKTDNKNGLCKEKKAENKGAGAEPPAKIIKISD